MNSFGISAAIFAFVFGSALAGMVVNSILPESHLSPDSRDVVKLTMGLLATMAALVLGLLTSSAKSTFDAQDNEVKQIAAQVIALDRTLAQYGPETREIRGKLRQLLADRVAKAWPDEPTAPIQLQSAAGTAGSETVEADIRLLQPKSDSQRGLQSRALEIVDSAISARWLVLTLANSGLPLTLLIVLTFWLAVLFASFGLFAPRNGTVVAALLLCALSVAGSTLLILEMSQPFKGIMRISSQPLRYALTQLGQ